MMESCPVPLGITFQRRGSRMTMIWEFRTLCAVGAQRAASVIACRHPERMVMTRP